jgi:hypothetical protein
MHSWRVLILPYLEPSPLWSRYRFDEPWDGPNNQQLAVRLPVYRCPADGSRTPTATSYVMVTGPGTASEVMAKNLPKLQASPNRILIVEVVDSGIDWMEPRDLTLEEARAGIDRPEGGISGTPPERPHVLMANGTVYSLPETIAGAELDALLTKDLSDAEIEDLIKHPPPRSSNVRSRLETAFDEESVRFAVWLISLVVLLGHGLIVDARDHKRKAGETPSPAADAGPAPGPTAPDRQER